MEVSNSTLIDWLDDLCVRFIINLPEEELASVERICFQIEEAQWFYEDFVRPLDLSLPSMNLKKFSMVIFQHCPLLSQFSQYHHLAAFEEFLAYKTRVPVRGAIMLNEDMTEVVLVKGWKKGAKWSFPRGKINKGESDLDCAVREVYEETGFDLRETGLVDRDPEHKSIEVSMREQHMQLFVFRGIPMDSAFEPKTRKEISKIEWYKLAELPMVKHEKVHQHEDTRGANLQQHPNKFYMVAPFLGPLRQWIKQQKKLDRLGISDAVVAAMPTNDQTIQKMAISDVAAILSRGQQQGTAGQANMAEKSQHLENLVAGLRASSNLTAPTSESLVLHEDPALELKRMLSIGNEGPQSTLALASPPAANKSNALLAMLRSSSSQAPQIQSAHIRSPHTPLEQITNVAPQPHTPHHHQQHVRQQHVPTAPEPPQLSYHGQKPVPITSDLSQLTPADSRTGFQESQYAPRVPLPHNTNQLLNNFRSAARDDNFAGATPQITTSTPFSLLPQQPWQQLPHHQQQSEGGRFDKTRQTVVPPASKLPPPTLNAHTMSLLSAFKSPSQLPASPIKVGPRSEVSELSGTEMHGRSPPSAPSVNDSSFTFPSNKVSAEIARTMPKNPLQHRTNLLDIFNSKTLLTQSIHNRGQEPVELAAQSSPHPDSQMLDEHFAKPTLGLQTVSLPQSIRSELTSATITGPLHSPNFDHLRINQHHNDWEQDRNIVTTHTEPVRETDEHTQQPTLDSVETKWPPPVLSSVGLGATIEAPKPVSYSLLQNRQLQNALPRQATPVSSGSPFDRRGSIPQAQQNALLSLFNSSRTASPKTIPSAVVGLPTDQVQAQNAALSELAATPHPAPGLSAAQRLSLKPTTNVISPISPLPGSGRSLLGGSTLGSPNFPDARSRISSIDSLAGIDVASETGSSPSSAIAYPTESLARSMQPIPPHNVPTELPQSLAGSRKPSLGTGAPSLTTSADKGALLGFLAGVANKGAKP